MNQQTGPYLPQMQQTTPFIYYNQNYPYMLQHPGQEMITNQSALHPPQMPQQPQQAQLKWMPMQNSQPIDLRNGTEWTYVASKKKRSRIDSPEKPAKSVKQSKLADYWLNAPRTSNSFAALETEDSNKIIDENVDEQDRSPEEEKMPKPPPIFVSGVNCISPLDELLSAIAKDDYVTKLQGSEQVKIQPLSTKSYSAIIKALEDKKTEFHTYQQKQKRSFRVVVKGIHYSTDIQKIKTAIEACGHAVTNVSNIRKRITKEPLPMFYVELEQKDNNKDIYKLKKIGNSCVEFEPPHQKREIPQCTKCQRYGHTKKFCYRSPRCVKCAKDHLTSDCNRKERSDLVKCVHCDGNHPANYRGCKIYKELQNKKYPPLRSKPTSISVPRNQPERQMVYQNVTYAQTVGNQLQQPHIRAPFTQQPELPNLPEQQKQTTASQTNDMHELKQMMKGLMEQMGTMLNLLTALVTKRT